MKTTLDCIPCLLRQALDVITLTCDDSGREELLRTAMREIATLDLGLTPPHIACHVHRVVREKTKVQDPFKAAKTRFNAMALDMLPGLRTQVLRSVDPFALAARMAIAGNVIDLGVHSGLTEAEARESIAQALQEPFHGDIAGFKKAASEAETILYLTDNAGEIVLDRLLLEQLAPKAVTVAVRGKPVLNDATMEDARLAGIPDMVECIDNGSDAPGTILEECRASFVDRFTSADLIIAKGQGNYETLNTVPGPIVFLFKVKCPVVAAQVGLDVGSQVLIQTPRDQGDASPDRSLDA